MNEGIWIGVLSVLGTLGVTYFGHWLGLSRETKLKQDEIDRHARYLAIRMVCILEPFVMRCCDVVNDNGLYHEGERHSEVVEPTLAFLSPIRR
jgi:hypothetical protein